VAYVKVDEALSYDFPFSNQPRLEVTRFESVAGVLIASCRHCSLLLSERSAKAIEGEYR
jgi:hypothetical protein